MSNGLLFPGQGSQTPGFLHALPSHAAVQGVFDEASQYLGDDVLKLDSAETLATTVAAQMSMLTAGVAFVRYLKAEGIAFEVAAGMSVGAFAAAVAAGAIAFSDALRFVQRRAELMDAAFPMRHGMVVVEGLRERTVGELLQNTGITIANYNSPVQFVLAGERDELLRFLPVAKAGGAHTAMLLGMATASHTADLANAARELHAFAETLPMQNAAFPVISNRTARPLLKAVAICEDLAWNMAYPVRWHDVQAALYGFGVTRLFEAPPGHTLTRLATEAYPDLKVLAAADLRWDILLREARRTV
ncbi:malonate decarboxylase epsilon subunit [Granulicella rosea]|uniref:[acyl-carrier-protein] S-malonyltransferase n=1 Tax=Granulicella rosea TaxID=474952 RepID=A0A239EGW4_9BACT|nr:acyltransferase domain-containing protein [Granulicella rosea]SNS43253.1 malonate decarboxylase epsilon subunit [Granulicella rosea]